MRWLRPSTAAPRTVCLSTVGHHLDALGPLDPADWRAAQLVMLLLGADLDGGAGQWVEEGTIRPLDLASRGGVPIDLTERAVGQLVAAGVLIPIDSPGVTGALRVRVAGECVTTGMPALVAWPEVVRELEGSPAALLVARAIAQCIERPGQVVVVPNPLLGRVTRYSEGMVKRGVAGVVRAGVVLRHPSAGRAPAYLFSDWALGRAATAPAHESPPTQLPSDRRGDRNATRRAEGPTAPSAQEARAATAGVHRVTLSGVSAEIPVETGGELVVRTEVDGRRVTARLTIPPARPE